MPEPIAGVGLQSRCGGYRLMNPWAEDRATVGTDLSADPRDLYGGSGQWCELLLLPPSGRSKKAINPNLPGPLRSPLVHRTRTKPSLTVCLKNGVHSTSHA